MAIRHSSSTSSPGTRHDARRRATVSEALDHAEAIADAEGVGAITISEIARRMQMRPPSLYKYFASLRALFDALFRRGQERLTEYVESTTFGRAPGLERLVDASRAMLRWGTEHPGLASLLFWRPIPGFQPSPEALQSSELVWQGLREDLAAAAERGDLAPSAATEESLEVLSLLLAGIGTAQLANEPGVSFEDGHYTAMTDTVLGLFLDYHAPAKTRPTRRRSP